ncbi:MAG: efflux RND transporter permease subunit [Planctomycetota bacterium]
MIAQFLVRNPRILLLIVGVIVVAGLSSFHLMPRLEDPVLGKRVAVISTVYPGADAGRVESLVTIQIEQRLQGIAEIKQVRSNSRAGISNIIIKLRDDVDDVDVVWSEVRNQIADGAVDLPEGCRRSKFEVFPLKAFAAIVSVKWLGPQPIDFSILRKLTAQLRQQIANLAGTESVEEFGNPGEHYLAEVEPTVLAALKLSTASIAGQIAANNATHPSGYARGPDSQLLLDMKQADSNLDRLQDAVIRYGPKGESVKLSEIARLSKQSIEPLTDVALVDGQRAIVLGAFFDDQLRVDRWSAQLEAVVEKFQQEYAAEIDVETIFSQQRFIDARLESLLVNLCLGAAAVVLVVLVLMGWRSMIVVGITLPLSALMVLSGMRVLQIPMHQMSVTGLIIALGLLIDNAIVIVEDVRARIFDGDSTLVAIRRGIRHLSMPLFGSTLTTALAFTPIATLPGPPGEFVGTIAVSVILAIGASFVLAMTVVPALLGLMSTDATDRSLWSYGISSLWIRRAYQSSLRAVLRVPPIGVLLGCVLPAFGFLFSQHLPEQFFPPSDRNQIQIEVELPARESVNKTLDTVKALHELVVAEPKIARAHWFVGRSAPTFYYNVVPSRRGTPFYAQAIVELTATDDVAALARSLQDRLSESHAECRIIVRQLEQGPPFDAPIEVRVSGPDLAELQTLGSELRLMLSQAAHVIHTRSDSEETIPKLVLDVDAEESSRAGQNTAELSGLLYTTLEGAPAGKLLDGEEELPVTVRMASLGRAQLDQLAALQLASNQRRGPTGPPDTMPKPSSDPPLAAIADFELGSDVAAIVRIDGQRTNEIKAYLSAGVLPAAAFADFERRLAAADFRLPPGYALDFGGEGAERSSAIQRLVANAALLFTLMILTLVISFRSFRCAAVIVLVGALAIGLGPLALWLFGYPFGFMAIVGTMGLVGVAINDSIVVLAAIQKDEAARLGDVEALSEVVVGCTRHIIATTLTTVVGFAPLILSGGGFWPPLAITIACGVGGATFLALYFVPSLNLLLHIEQVNAAEPG